ncbi:YbaN family protein [Colwellia sp. MSW7]|uniref:YbaN family protein n=1 Tax=Colwellia maritima TaxID=2912588 RepID=A0ABS9WZ77_9GAMM|nr:YbaN family protein [Colwellia maritima]
MNHNQESQIQERQSKEVVNSLNISIDECPVPVSTRGKIKVFLWKITGIFCVGLAILGAMLPVLPTTVFLLMATACFAKSSPKLQQKLLNNKTFGPLIHEWQQNRSIPRKAKRVALLMIVFSVVWSSYLLQNALLTLLVIALVIGPFIFLWRLPVSK